MIAVVVPVILFALIGLAVLGVVAAEKRPVNTWSDELQELREVARDKQPRDVIMIPQDVHLSDMLTVDDSAVYTGTDGFEGLVTMVEKTMDRAETASQAMRSRVATH